MAVSNAVKQRLQLALKSNTLTDELVSAIGFNTFGTVYYVDPTNGNDSWGGKSMDRAFATLAAAYAAATTNAHDIIVLTANAAHAITAQLQITKNRVHFIGLDPAGGLRHQGQRTRITSALSTGSQIAAIENTGVGNSFHNLKISSADTAATSVYGVADGGEFSVWSNCWIEKSSDLDQAGAAELLCNADTPHYINCTFGNMIYQPSVARQNVLFTRETITGKVCRSAYFDDCWFLSFPAATTFSNLRATTNDIERFALFKTPKFLAKVGGSTQVEAITIGSALTDGAIYLDRPFVDGNITNIATASSGVFSNLPDSASLGGKATEVT